MKKWVNKISRIAIFIVALLMINVLSQKYYVRKDLTSEKRYTLSQTTKKLIKKIENPIFIKVYLDGDLSPKFTKLKLAVRDMIEEIRANGGNNIQYQFVDILNGKKPEDQGDIIKTLSEKGITPYKDVEDLGLDEQKIKWVIPFGTVNNGGEQEYVLDFLSTKQGVAGANNINNSIENLEYEFANAIRKCLVNRKQKILFTEGFGELDTRHIADFTKELAKNFTLNRENINLADPESARPFQDLLKETKSEEMGKVLLSAMQTRLSTYDLIVVAKPTKEFSQSATYLLDQYIMGGGKVIWLLDAVNADMDSLRTTTSRTFFGNELEELNSLLFTYGASLNFDILADLRCSKIPLMSKYAPSGRETKAWVYYPLFTDAAKHPITKNLDYVWGRFAGTLRPTRRGKNKVTYLLLSSARSRTFKSPATIDLAMAANINKPEMINSFNKGKQVTGLLLEGSFKSPYVRGAKFTNLPFKKKVDNSAMIIIADGDIIKNKVTSRGEIYPLGFDRGTGATYSNKKFMLNCVDYLMDKDGLMEIRNKEIKMRLLDKGKIKLEKGKWQRINVVYPLLFLLFFAFLNTFIRKRKYAR